MSDKTKRPLTLEEATQPTTKEPSSDVRAWQEAEVRRGLKEADEGKFVTTEELKATARKFVPYE
ncbi:MAG: hypothetical protein RIC87_02600 [Kiloniellales bacterium]